MFGENINCKSSLEHEERVWDIFGVKGTFATENINPNPFVKKEFY